MRSVTKIAVLALVLVSIVSCKKDTRPNYQFMPNMYEPVPYETYQDAKAFKGDMEAQLPVEGTIPRGFSIYDIENTNEGYELAKATLASPLDSTQVDMERGKELYGIYCSICHGNQGKGDGQLGLGKRELILPGNYADKDITDGSIYHVIYYGKGQMGSYTNQLNEEERWQVVAYVSKLKADLEK
ncbi:c-type cytochrome [Winogradskyella sp. 3972H.M.0a.05]|uniref:c-type cytochrome n=1 Tax=Winogradskyella sp. 3972H.M.0a.05 TaxID=2950277 RepID=UPI003393D7BE